MAAPNTIVIVGGGVVGLSCALYAQLGGHFVTVIDPSDVASGATAGNAGVIAVSECLPLSRAGTLKNIPAMLLRNDGALSIRWARFASITPWLLRFVLASKKGTVERSIASLTTLLSLAKRAHHELAGFAKVDHLIVDTGWLKVFETDKAYQSSLCEFRRMARQGVDCEHLDGEQILKREPALAPIFRHGVVHRSCQQVTDPQAYAEAFRAEVIRRGGRIVQAEVLSLSRRNGVVCGVDTTGGIFDADCVVVAAGAWSKKFCGDVAGYVPLDTERGYHLMFTQGPPQLRGPVLWSEHAIVMSPLATGLRVTNGVELAGLRAPPDFRKIRRIIPEIRRALVARPQTPWSEWMGFRPSMPDSLPVIGRAPGAKNCYLAFGHGHLGLTLGPITGKIIAELIDNKDTAMDVTPFSASRFSRS